LVLATGVLFTIIRPVQLGECELSGASSIISGEVVGVQTNELYMSRLSNKIDVGTKVKLVTDFGDAIYITCNSAEQEFKVGDQCKFEITFDMIRLHDSDKIRQV
jgi:hypothetical protein